MQPNKIRVDQRAIDRAAKAARQEGRNAITQASRVTRFVGRELDVESHIAFKDVLEGIVETLPGTRFSRAHELSYISAGQLRMAEERGTRRHIRAILQQAARERNINTGKLTVPVHKLIIGDDCKLQLLIGGATNERPAWQLLHESEISIAGVKLATEKVTRVASVQAVFDTPKETIPLLDDEVMAGRPLGYGESLNINKSLIRPIPLLDIFSRESAAIVKGTLPMLEAVLGSTAVLSKFQM